MKKLMKLKTLSAKWFPVSLGLLILGLTTHLRAQDPRERVYNYPILKPSHAEKPAVQGWAKQRVVEKLNRGMSAVLAPDGSVHLSWRLLHDDPEGIAFNVYRSAGNGKAVKLNRKPLLTTTGFVDTRPLQAAEYRVRPVAGGLECEFSEAASVIRAENRLPLVRQIRLQGDYLPDRIGVGDLNGDGEYDYVVKQPGGQVDPGVWRKSTDTFKLEAYLSDGTFLWQKDLGWNIELGIWYSPFVVFDFNGDGKAEIAVKTAPVDRDFRDENGRVFDGPEYCSLLDGMTGEELTRVEWAARTPRLGDYNRNSRHQLGVAYLDGKTPCLLVCRGTYRMMQVDAYQFTNNTLERLWRWDGDEENPVVRSQGAHSLHSVDLDEDGRDEIVLGSAVLDDNGTLLYSVGVGHPDKCFVTDIDPNRPGMEIFYANEVWHDSLGVCMVEAKSGKMIWNIGRHTQHVGEGMVADIDPDLPGLECFAQESGKADPQRQNYGGRSPQYAFSAAGKEIPHPDIPDFRNWLFWDADLLREYAGGNRESSQRTLAVKKYKGELLTAGIEGSVRMIADLTGDWREELVTVIPGEIRVYATPVPATDRRVCLMQDPLYRSDVAHRSMGYDQSPVTTYYLGVK